ncbi:unnamed protein product [Rhodiola kirilowii]
MEPILSEHDETPSINNVTPGVVVDVSPTVKSKLTSVVWNHFKKLDEEVIDGKKVQRAKCNICNVTLICSGTSGTSHLSRHAKTHASAHLNASDIRSQMLLAKDRAGMLSTYAFDNKKARLEIVEYLIRAELPFTFVDSHDFAGMIQRGFAPQFKKFSAQTCKRDVMKMFSCSKADLVSYFDSFKGKVCFTSDMWSSRQKMGYLSLTAHWIDDTWIMQKRILSFKMVEYPHTGDSLATHVYEELITWHLHDKIFSLTLDNASSNDVLVTQLGSRLMLSSINNHFLHVRCTCHILNLIVQDGLAVLAPSIEKITTIVRSMNSSIKRHELWLKSCAELGLSKRNIDIDVPHRWNSTYELLNVAVKYKTALHRYCQKINESRNCSLVVPSEHDWVVATLCMNFLSIFSSATKVCSGVYSPTANKAASSNAVGFESIDVNIPIVPANAMSRLKRARVSTNSSSSDLQMYLDLDTLEVVEDATFNILGWWKANSSMYPILSVMAKDILSVPASTVASEAAFSAGGRVVSDKRASLSPNTIEALICLKDWSLAKDRMQEAAAEEAAAEEMMNALASRPDWLQESDEADVSTTEEDLPSCSAVN